MTTESEYEVLIIGGSAAGLSAALSLGRARRRVLVLDGGKPCNRQAPHSHNFFTRDGETPQQLLAIAREQLLTYPTVQLLPANVVRAAHTTTGFQLTTDTDQTFVGRKVVLATGMHDELPTIPGFATCWGVSVLHCPYCHGYEVHSQPLGVLSNGDAGFEFARLIHQWSADLRLFTNGPATFSAEQRHTLAAHQITVIETPIAELEHNGGALHHLRLTSGERVPRTALFARVPLTQPSDLYQQLGCALTEQGLIRVDDFGHTTTSGVFAAGDNSSPMRSIAAASASGTKTGAFLNHELIAEDF